MTDHGGAGLDKSLFYKFVDLDASEVDQLRGILAYGLYKKAKAEWMQGIWKAKDRAPTEDELRLYHDTWTQTSIDAMSNRADSALAAFGERVVDEATAGILRDALRGSFRRAVLSSILGLFLFALILVGVAFGFYYLGVDVAGVLQKITPPKAG